jgi:hypothetical protein
MLINAFRNELFYELQQVSMHYEKAPLLQKVAVVMGAASAALRCAVQGLRSATAALGSNCNGEWGGKGLQKDIGKSASEWHFYLEGKDNR